MILLDFLLDLLYPPRCCFCHKITDKERICQSCLKSLPYTGNNSSQTNIPNIVRAVSPLYYEGDVRLSVHRFKFHSATGYAKAYAALMADAAEDSDIYADFITWVPLSKKRMRNRGYNQAQLICEELSVLLDIPQLKTLSKIRNNPAQSSTGNAKMRKANVKGVYKVEPGIDIKGKTVIIVDDVITTGSTVSECARMLKEAGCKDVFALSLARSK